jgi:hypothetical protein
MRYRIGRLLQIAGLILLPQGIVLELLGHVTLGQSLLIALGGIAVFMLGVAVQRGARS